MNFKNVFSYWLAIFLLFLSFPSLFGREILFSASNASERKLTIYIKEPIPFYLLEKKGWVTRDILLSVWLEWARLNHASLSLEIVNSPTSIEPHLEGNQFFISSHLLPEPRLGSEFLTSSSLLKNQLSLIKAQDTPLSAEETIGVLKDVYPTWLSLSFSNAVNKEKVVLYSHRENMIQDLENKQIDALVDYPMVFWHLAQNSTSFTASPVGYPPALNTLDASVAKAWWSLQEELLRIPAENLEKLKQEHLSLLAEKEKPSLSIALEKDYAPFSFASEGKMKGLLVDYANSYFLHLGVPYTLSFWEDYPPASFDIHWGLKPSNTSSRIFSFYQTPLVLISLQDLAVKTNSLIGFEVPESYLSDFQQLYPKVQWIKEDNLKAPVDAWVWEGARLPQSLLERENKTLISQAALYQKMIPFSLEAQEDIKGFFQENGEKILERVSRTQWQREENQWVKNPLYRTLSYKGQPFTLNEGEKLWIYHHNTLKVGINPNGNLLESLDNYTNLSLSDIFLRKMTEQLNLKIQKIPVNSSSELKELWEKGEIDVYLSYEKEAYQETTETRSFSLWKIPLSLYTHHSKKLEEISREDLQKSSLGLWTTIARESALDTPFGEVLYFPSPDKTIQSLVMNETDWIFMDPYNAQFLAHKYKQQISPLSVQNPLNIYLNLNIQPRDPILYALLEKSFLALSEPEKDKMVEDWINDWEPKSYNFWRLFLFFPVLMTVMIIISVNYKSFSVKLRHRDDLNKKLAEAEKIANRANASKSEFITNISHELRTCLNGIIGMTELLKKTHLDKNQEEYFTILRSSSQTLVTIVDDLLDVSRIENRRIHLENTPFSLVNYLKGVVDNMKKMNTNSKVNILLRTFNLPSELIKGDFIRLGQILNNLLRNSLKFTESGLVKLTVSSFKRQYKKIWIEFNVEDTGIGIPEDGLEDLFEAFSQAHDDLSVRKGGVGLGLYICQSLVELMDGTPIEVKSKEGEGATFSFKIPFQLTNLGAEQLEEYSLEDFKEKQALILEKDPNQILHFSEILLKMGLSYKIASSASEVLSFLQRESFDLFFVEEVFLKQDPSTLSLIPYHNYQKDRIFILAGAGKDVHSLKETLDEEGFYDFLSYPYEKQEILAKLKKFFGSSQNLPPSRVLTERFVFKNTKVLLVEDHSINQKVLATMLENVGIQIDLASTGAEGLSQFKRNFPYDLVFMDIQLPDKNGFTITQEIRDWERFYKRTHTPIISITANAMHGYKNLCLEKGLDDYLSKPIFFDSLLTMLKNWVTEEKQVIISQEEALLEIPEIPFMPNLPYLDLPQTLANLDLSIEEYLPILSKTYESCYQEIFVPFHDQVSGKIPLDKKELAKHSHSLAGVLGNLGVLELCKDLKACENWALEENSLLIDDFLKETGEKVEHFFSALEKLGSKRESSYKEEGTL